VLELGFQSYYSYSCFKINVIASKSELWVLPLEALGVQSWVPQVITFVETKWINVIASKYELRALPSETTWSPELGFQSYYICLNKLHKCNCGGSSGLPSGTTWRTLGWVFKAITLIHFLNINVIACGGNSGLPSGITGPRGSLMYSHLLNNCKNLEIWTWGNQAARRNLEIPRLGPRSSLICSLLLNKCKNLEIWTLDFPPVRKHLVHPRLGSRGSRIYSLLLNKCKNLEIWIWGNQAARRNLEVPRLGPRGSLIYSLCLNECENLEICT
jgi:IS1 family transposase